VKYEPGYWGLCGNGIWNVKWLWSATSPAHNELIFQGYNDSTHAMGVDWTQTMGAAWENGTRVTHYSSDGTAYYTMGDWMHVEAYMQLSSGIDHTNADGVYWAKVNGTRVIDDNTVISGTPGFMYVPALKASCDAPSGQGWWQLDDFQVWDDAPADTAPSILLYSDGFENAAWSAACPQSADVSHGGAYSAKCTHDQTVANVKTLDYETMKAYKDITVRYWWYTADSWPNGAGVKFARLRHPTSNIQWEQAWSENLGSEIPATGLTSWTFAYNNVSDGSCALSPAQYGGPIPLKRGQWQQVQIHYVLNDPGTANGRYEISFDNTVVLSRTNQVFRCGNDSVYNMFYLPSNIGTSSANAINYIDDVEIWATPVSEGSTGAPAPPVNFRLR
jgi:hypothetical protein